MKRTIVQHVHTNIKCNKSLIKYILFSILSWYIFYARSKQNKWTMGRMDDQAKLRHNELISSRLESRDKPQILQDCYFLVTLLRFMFIFYLLLMLSILIDAKESNLVPLIGHFTVCFTLNKKCRLSLEG